MVVCDFRDLRCWYLNTFVVKILSNLSVGLQQMIKLQNCRLSPCQILLSHIVK